MMRATEQFILVRFEASFARIVDATQVLSYRVSFFTLFCPFMPSSLFKSVEIIYNFYVLSMEGVSNILI